MIKRINKDVSIETYTTFQEFKSLHFSINIADRKLFVNRKVMSNIRSFIYGGGFKREYLFYLQKLVYSLNGKSALPVQCMSPEGSLCSCIMFAQPVSEDLSFRLVFAHSAQQEQAGLAMQVFRVDTLTNPFAPITIFTAWVTSESDRLEFSHDNALSDLTSLTNVIFGGNAGDWAPRLPEGGIYEIILQ